MKFEGKKVPCINYAKLKPRQQERFNFQKASAILVDFGFATFKIDVDWNGADFLAHHIKAK